MPDTEKKPQPARYRERKSSEPQGFAKITHHIVRVVETLGEIPQGCEPTTDEPHDWKLEETP